MEPAREDEAVRELIRAADRLNTLNRRPATTRPAPRTIPEYIAGAFPTVQGGSNQVRSNQVRSNQADSVDNQGEKERSRSRHKANFS